MEADPLPRADSAQFLWSQSERERKAEIACGGGNPPWWAQWTRFRSRVREIFRRSAERIKFPRARETQLNKIIKIPKKYNSINLECALYENNLVGIC